MGLVRRKKEEPLTEFDKMDLPKTGITAESATIENVKVKMDLVLTQLDSLRAQYEAISERVITMERMLRELYAMAKS